MEDSRQPMQGELPFSCVLFELDQDFIEELAGLLILALEKK